MSDDDQDVLALLIRHELAIGEFYQALAVIDAPHQSFWTAIAADEQRHADALETFRSNAIAGKWFRFSSPLKAPAIQASIRYVESALIERHFSKILNVAPQEIRPILTGLVAETEKHLRGVVARMNEEKR